MDKPRPRTFSTLQLTTQKFKLRSLERIIGCNINIIKEKCIDGNEKDDDDGLVFYSLHHNSDEPAFYCSENLPLHLKSQKWAEIVWKCPEIAKSDQNCVCVKVWLRKKLQCSSFSTHSELTRQSKQVGHQQVSFKSALSSSEQIPISHFKETKGPDKLIFSWAVYFSGLSMLCRNADVIFSENSLIFQLNGAYFSSPDRFTTAKSQEQLTPTYQRHVISSSAPTSTFQVNSPQVSRSPSPSLIPSQRNAVENTRGRVMQIYFPRNTVRSSYDLNILLKIQEKIRVRLQKIRESNDMVNEVKLLSVRCVTKNELQRRTRNTSSSYSSSSYHQIQNHSMGRKLSILLSEQQHVEPASLLRAQKLQQQLETIRSKHELLLSEQTAFRSRNQNLRFRLDTLKTAREQLEKNLEINVNQLLIEKTLLADRKQEHINQLHLRRHVAEHMERRMTSLCLELQEIYPIRRNSHGYYTVSGIPFPSLDTYANHSSSSISSEQMSPLALSTSLGYVAHLTQMISVILDQPLRNPIIHEGSRSRIQDVIKEVPYGSRDFPLYSRSLIPSKLVKYAMFLLNQNIAQLCFEITGVCCDLRDTIENLLRIFSAFSQFDQNMYEGIRLHLRTHPSNRLNIKRCVSNGSITKENNREFSTDDCDGFSKTRSSMDIRDLNVANSSSSVPSVSQIGDNKTRYRCSRSVGSYSDSEVDNFKIVKHTFFNSDSNIKFYPRRPT